MILRKLLLVVLLIQSQLIFAQSALIQPIKKTHKMKIEIWSDIMCPFCFIGKHKLEAALEELTFKDQLEIQWKSFQLSPDFVPEKGVDMYDQLAKMKGATREWSIQAHQQVAAMGRTAGIEFNFDQAISANTLNALRLMHLADKYKLGTSMKEELFQAHFVDGQDIGEDSTLISIAKKVGIAEAETQAMLNTDLYVDEVKKDQFEAQQIGVQGVPFFVLDRKYAISGAQDVAVFKESLEKSFQEWLKQNPVKDLQIIDGKVCRIDGTCD